MSKFVVKLIDKVPDIHKLKLYQPVWQKMIDEQLLYAVQVYKRKETITQRAPEHTWNYLIIFKINAIYPAEDIIKREQELVET